MRVSEGLVRFSGPRGNASGCKGKSTRIPTTSPLCTIGASSWAWSTVGDGVQVRSLLGTPRQSIMMKTERERNRLFILSMYVNWFLPFPLQFCFPLRTKLVGMASPGTQFRAAVFHGTTDTDGKLRSPAREKLPDWTDRASVWFARLWFSIYLLLKFCAPNTVQMVRSVVQILQIDFGIQIDEDFHSTRAPTVDNDSNE